jgi:hypothetical protein
MPKDRSAAGGGSTKRQAGDLVDSRLANVTWQSRRPREIPFRPVTLRPHLSMSLPFSNHPALCLKTNRLVISTHNCLHFPEQRASSMVMAVELLCRLLAEHADWPHARSPGLGGVRRRRYCRSHSASDAAWADGFSCGLRFFVNVGLLKPESQAVGLLQGN